MLRTQTEEEEDEYSNATYRVLSSVVVEEAVLGREHLVTVTALHPAA